MYGPYFIKCHACGKTYIWNSFIDAAPSAVRALPMKSGLTMCVYLIWTAQVFRALKEIVP